MAFFQAVPIALLGQFIICIGMRALRLDIKWQLGKLASLELLLKDGWFQIIDLEFEQRERLIVWWPTVETVLLSSVRTSCETRKGYKTYGL